MKSYGHMVLRSPRGTSAKKLKDNVWRKELAYPGTFVKVNKNREVEFELPIDEGRIDHWVGTFHEMQKDGIPVPVPKGHTDDIDERRGTVLKLSKEPSETPGREGQPALFCYIKYNNPDDGEKYKDTDVSLYMPQEFTSGAGKTYKQPIRHVALTDYPVIPGLGKFHKAVALSFVACDLEEESGEDMPSSLAALAQKMGIQIPEGADDQAAEDAILQAWEQGGEGGAGEGTETPPSGESDEDMDDEGGMGSPGDDPPPEAFEDDLGTGEDDDGDEPPPRRGASFQPPPSLAFSHVPKTIVTQISKSRQGQIDDLVKNRKLSPAAGKALSKIYCHPDRVAFALSFEAECEDDSITGDDFEAVVAACSLNVAAPEPKERTGPQHGAEGTEQQPVVKDAAARQARANAFRRR